MASRGVPVFKFVGTVMLGLSTGLSYTLTTLTIPALLTLPSADAASRAFDAVTHNAKRKLRGLTSFASASFFAAYYLSPTRFRHPYLLYTSLLIGISQFSDLIVPYVFTKSAKVSSSSSSEAAAAKKRSQQKKRREERARMEASYEVLTSSVHSEGTPSVSDDDDLLAEQAEVNGEEVRAKVEAFLEKQLLEGGILLMSFAMAVVGIWGDGALGRAVYPKRY
ncbi:hypothetical protein QBC42DRAFT_293548 [Cladorrhinum samala]|uniref:Autophagy-related protein 33 n=1 Tax=Cladorrhinum samala TaxID=585594 RepID=A0AAV9I1I3_9PEZI|nr:hypothetical protein QBC42DRAFT_293548 [Cladorrhinum samala]